MHVGEKPYVVTAGGHAELAANALTVSAMTGMLDQLLPAESRNVLNELGAVEYHLPPDQASPATRYSVVAARGGNDIWIEIRRHKLVERPVEMAVQQTAQQNASVALEEPPAPIAPAAPVLPAYEELPRVAEQTPAVETVPTPAALMPEAPAAEPEVPTSPPYPDIFDDPGDGFQLTSLSEDDLYSMPPIEEDLDADPLQFDDLPPSLDFSAPSEPPPAAESIESAAPIARVNARVEPPARPSRHADPLRHLLTVAAGHGSSALYVAPLARPSLRVDGEIRVLDEAPLTEVQLDEGLRSLLGLQPGAPLPIGEVETREVPEVGRVQYLGFHEHRGLGAMFRMLPARAISSEQSGLSPAIQALCTEPEGLLLVAGGRDGGKSTLVSALVDQINRTRRDHVITVESEIPFVHANRMSFISQREARNEIQFSDTLRSALREAPDVIVIDGTMNAEVAATALRAAADGQLVVVSVTAATTASAIERFVGFCGGDPAEAQSVVAEHLRGVITQSLLRKTGGGRAAAREVLVNVPSAASLVRAAQYDQIAAVINSGRRVGMVPLNDALLALVQGGALDARQAYRKSPDPGELLEMLTAAGFDTAFASKLA
jgi:twitching motility protein PilT